MLYLEKNPILCANATPICFYGHIISSAKDTLEALSSSKQYSLKEGSLPSLILADLMYSQKNLEWYDSYITTLIKNARCALNKEYPFLDFTNVSLPDIDIEYFTNSLNIHSPLADNFYEKIYEENKYLYDRIGNDTLLLSRAILLDLRPQRDDFIDGQPQWFTDMSDKEIFSAYDMQTRKHYKIERDEKGNIHYFTSYVNDNWEEIENVPEGIYPLINYLLSNRPNLTLIDKT